MGCLLGRPDSNQEEKTSFETKNTTKAIRRIKVIETRSKILPDVRYIMYIKYIQSSIIHYIR